MCKFFSTHWEWLSGFVASCIGVLITIKAYQYAKRANEDTNTLIKQSVEDAVGRKSKEEIRDRIIQTALSEWRLKGQTSEYLRLEYNRLNDQGWSQEEFEKIYADVAMRYKGRMPKKKLFGEID